VEIVAAGELLRRIERGEFVRDSDVIRVVGGAIHSVGGDAEPLLGRLEVVVDLPPLRVVGYFVSDEHGCHSSFFLLVMIGVPRLEHRARGTVVL